MFTYKVEIGVDPFHFAVHTTKRMVMGSPDSAMAMVHRWACPGITAELSIFGRLQPPDS